MDSVRSSARLRHKMAKDLQVQPPKPNVKSKESPERHAPTAASRKRQKKSNAVEEKMTAKMEVSTVRVKGRRGHLKQVTEMPLDIFYEIVGYMGPQDVLNLSWANRASRFILLSRSAIAVWRNAFKNAVPAPPRCPDELNLPQYANFLYGKHCLICAASGWTTVFWTTKARYCRDCLLEIFFRKPVRDSLSIELYTALVVITVQMETKFDNKRQIFYLKSDYEKHLQKLRELEDDHAAFSQYVSQERRNSFKRHQEVYLFMEWERALKRAHSDELAKNRLSRKEAIFEKIKDSGWGTELEKLDHMQLLKIPGLNSPKVLTGRGWENLKPEIIGYLEQCRVLRLQNERKGVMRNRFYALGNFISQHLKSLPKRFVFPCTADLFQMDCFRFFTLDPPLEEGTIQTTFEHMEPLIASSGALWRENKDKFLVGLLPNSKKRRSKSTCKSESLSRLNLATTFFACAWCTEPISYPRVLAHNCFYNNLRSGQCESEDEFVVWEYNEDGVSFDEEASNYAEAIISACGEDPKTITATQMDDKDIRLECLRCIQPYKRRLVMKWKIAILHELDIHHDEHSAHGGWRKVDDADMPKVLEQEYKNIVRYKDNRSFRYCRFCDLWMTMLATLTHRADCIRKDEHDEWIEKNFYADWDAPMKQMPYAVRIR